MRCSVPLCVFRSLCDFLFLYLFIPFFVILRLGSSVQSSFVSVSLCVTPSFCFVLALSPSSVAPRDASVRSWIGWLSVWVLASCSIWSTCPRRRIPHHESRRSPTYPGKGRTGTQSSTQPNIPRALWGWTGATAISGRCHGSVMLALSRRTLIWPTYPSGAGLIQNYLGPPVGLESAVGSARTIRAPARPLS